MGINHQWKSLKTIFSVLISISLVLGMVACGDRAVTSESPGNSKLSQTQIKGTISEVSPPEVIQQLRESIDIYKPQISIISPKADEIIEDTNIEVRLQVKDLPMFKSAELGLGPHLHVILDNQPYVADYDIKKPLVFKDLAPGTHTLRAFASRPWHESFKNEGAYSQTTFHIFTKTPNNNPDPAQPVLTYSRPTGNYGAEPIMLDFYLTNAPLHLVAAENPQVADWRIRATINGQSFILDSWQPLYLKGFKPGKNWVQLEFIDENGNPINNVFNNTARVITYEPKGEDALSKLIRGELSAEAARGIVEPNYKPQPIPTPTVTPTVIPTPLPTPPEATVKPDKEVKIPSSETTKTTDTEVKVTPAETTPTEVKVPPSETTATPETEVKVPPSETTAAPETEVKVSLPEATTPTSETELKVLPPEATPTAPPKTITTPESTTIEIEKKPEKSKYSDYLERYRRGNSNEKPEQNKVEIKPSI